jgi:hypothetical protein
VGRLQILEKYEWTEGARAKRLSRDQRRRPGRRVPRGTPLRRLRLSRRPALAHFWRHVGQRQSQATADQAQARCLLRVVGRSGRRSTWNPLRRPRLEQQSALRVGGNHRAGAKRSQCVPSARSTWNQLRSAAGRGVETVEQARTKPMRPEHAFRVEPTSSAAARELGTCSPRGDHREATPKPMQPERVPRGTNSLGHG